MFYYQGTVSAPVWSDKAYIYLRISLFFLAALYMHLVYPSVESEVTAVLICTFHNI